MVFLRGQIIVLNAQFENTLHIEINGNDENVSSDYTIGDMLYNI